MIKDNGDKARDRQRFTLRVTDGRTRMPRLKWRTSRTEKIPANVTDVPCCIHHACIYEVKRGG